MGARRGNPFEPTVSWAFAEYAPPGVCPECAGAGVVLEQLDDDRFPEPVFCQRCRGAGKIHEVKNQLEKGSPSMNRPYPLDIPPDVAVFVVSHSGAWAPLKDNQMQNFAYADDAQWLLEQAQGLVENPTLYNGVSQEGKYYGLTGGVAVYYLTTDGPRAYVLNGTTNIGGQPHEVNESVGQLLSRYRAGARLVAHAVAGGLAELSWQ